MAIPETPITRQEMYLDAIAKNAGGGGGSALPAVTSADNGKVLSVVDGAWAADDKRFVVTLTPTAADYSGTMDKTMGQIRAAYNAGKEIWFTLGTQAAPVSYVGEFEPTRAVFFAYVILTANNLLAILQASNADDTVSTYTTTTYQLTPMGS